MTGKTRRVIFAIRRNAYALNALQTLSAAKATRISSAAALPAAETLPG